MGVPQLWMGYPPARDGVPHGQDEVPTPPPQDGTACGVLHTQRAACLLRSRRRTFLCNFYEHCPASGGVTIKKARSKSIFFSVFRSRSVFSDVHFNLDSISLQAASHQSEIRHFLILLELLVVSVVVSCCRR